MNTHCHRCGGLIASPGGTMYQEPSGTTPVAIPHGALCRCDHAVISRTPSGQEPERQLRGVYQRRSASRN